MKHKIYAIDSGFITSVGMYPYDVRCEMLKTAGYDAIMPNLSWKTWEDVPKFLSTPTRHGIDVHGVYFTVDLAMPCDGEYLNKRLNLFDNLPQGSLLSFSIQASYPDEALRKRRLEQWLSTLLRAAEQTKRTLSLYPHIGLWTETFEDCIKICRQNAHPLLKSTFSALQWYAARSKSGLAETLAPNAQLLGDVNLTGVSRNGPCFGCTTAEVGRGEFDAFALLAILQTLDYQKALGVNCWHIGGYPLAVHERSLAAIRKMEQDLEQFPDWIPDFTVHADF